MKGATRRRSQWHVAAMLLWLVPFALGGSAAAADACGVELQDGFESGTAAGWMQAYSGQTTVIGQGAITGRYALSARMGQTNALVRSFRATTSVNLEFKLDLASVRGYQSPIIATISNNRAGSDAVWFYIYKPGGGPATAAVRAFRGRRDFEDSPYQRLASDRTLVRIEWRRGSTAIDGSVRLLLDGALVWTSRTLGNLNDTVDDLYLGSMGGEGGVGSAIIDDVVLENCDLPVSPPVPDAGPPADAAPPVDAASPDDAFAAAEHPIRTVERDALPELDGFDGVPDANPNSAEAGTSFVDNASDWRVGCACQLGAGAAAGGALPGLLASMGGLLLARRRRRRATTPS